MFRTTCQILLWLYSGPDAGQMGRRISSLIVYDIIAENIGHISKMMNLFIKHLLNDTLAKIVRIPVNYKNIYANKIKKSGFIKRDEENMIQIFAAPSYLSLLREYPWFSTAGDKDV